MVPFGREKFLCLIEKNMVPFGKEKFFMFDWGEYGAIWERKVLMFD
jgi:hypothetical protein